MSVKFCGKCGSGLKEGAKFCPKCGWQVPIIPEGPNKTISKPEKISSKIFCQNLFHRKGVHLII